MVPGCRLCTEHSWAPLGDIEIDLEDPALGPDLLHQHGDSQLQPFAKKVSGRPQEKVLRDLHGYRTGAARVAEAVLLSLAEHRLHFTEVHAVVVAELAILRADDRADKVWG